MPLRPKNGRSSANAMKRGSQTLPLFTNPVCEFLCRNAGAGSGEVGGDEVPVDQMVEEGFDELRAQVAVVDVGGVFPDVDAEQGLVAGGQRGAGSAHVDDVERTVGLFHQPGPAGTEVADGGGLEGGLEGIQRAPLGIDCFGQRAGRGATAVRGHAVPEEGMVPDLGGVVVDAAGRCLLDDGFEVEVLVLGALDQVVQVNHVGVVVLAVVVVEGFGRHVRGQGVLGVRQGGQLMFHCFLRCVDGGVKCVLL